MVLAVEETKKAVKCVETGIIYESAGEAAKQLNLDRASIVKVCNGKRKTCGGYHWEYV